MIKNVYYILIILSMFFVLVPTYAISIADKQWEEYKKTYHSGNEKLHNFAEESFRKDLFEKELKLIELHNEQFSRGEVNYQIGLNEFSIYTEEEMEAYLGVKGFPEQEENANVSLFSNQMYDLPAAFDWRQHIALNPPKNQGPCGSCWIFASIAGLEAAYAIKKQHVSLSEQQLVDCLKGCRGGWPANALEYIKRNGGVQLDRDYPYTGREHKCHYNSRKTHVTVSNQVRLPRGNEAELKKAVATVGPVVVAVHVEGHFKKYSNGVYSSPFCSNDGQILNHAMTVVGYGSEKGLDYWIVRNSWGPQWGEKGHIRMVRNRNNNCGISSVALYPTI